MQILLVTLALQLVSSPSIKRLYSTRKQLSIFTDGHSPLMVPIPTVCHPCQLGLDDQCQGSSSSAINYYHCRQHSSPSAKGQHTIFSANRVNIFLSTRRDIFLSARRKPGPSSDVLCGTQPHIRDTARWQSCCALLFQPRSSVSVPSSCLLPVRCSYVTAPLYMYLHCISASISLADILYCCIQPYWAVQYVYVHM